MKHKVKNIHFVGIGGSGMSGIAEVLVTLGYNVSGSDLGSNAVTQRLVDMGATVHQGHDASYIGNADAVVPRLPSRKTIRKWWPRARARSLSCRVRSCSVN